MFHPNELMLTFHYDVSEIYIPELIVDEHILNNKIHIHVIVLIAITDWGLVQILQEIVKEIEKCLPKKILREIV